MLTKKEVEKLICHRFWIHKAVTEENNFILIFMGDASASGFLVIQFETNGEITFPTHLGFQPGEYARWDFDEEKQEILFFDKNNNISNRGSLPTKWINDDHIIQLLNGNNGILVDDSNTNTQQVTTRVLGGKHMYFTSRQAFNMDLFHDISRADFNLKLLDYQDSLIGFFDQAYEYIAQHPSLEKIVIAKDGPAVIKLPEENQLLFAEDAQHPSFNYFAGSRARVMELLIIILSENNKRLLNPDDYRTEGELLSDVLNNQYYGQFSLTQVS